MLLDFIHFKFYFIYSVYSKGTLTETSKGNQIYKQLEIFDLHQD